MAGWSARLKGLLGGKEPVVKKPPPAKTYNAPSDRAALLAEAMAIYRRERVNVMGVLERALKTLQAKPPKPSDVAGMTRLLSLRQAFLNMKGHMAHDQRRLKVLEGVRGLLGTSQGAVADPKPKPAAKPVRSQSPSQGSKR